MAVVVNQFFWGMILIFFDVNLGFIDVLPDVVGYILISRAFETLQKDIPKASKGMAATWIALVIHVLMKVIDLRGEWPLFSSIIGGIFQVALLVVIYYLCEVTYILLGKIGEGFIAKESQSFEAVSYNLTSRVIVSQETTKDRCSQEQINIKNNWNVYCYTSLINMGLSAFAINEVEGSIMRVAILVIIINLIVVISLILRLRNIKNIF